jgi:hypothetical protein
MFPIRHCAVTHLCDGPVYTVPRAGDGPVYTVPMSRRTHVLLTDRQHAFLVHESARTGLPQAELVRRAIDYAYRPHARSRIRGFEISLGAWKTPDAAVIGRRAGPP